MPNRPPDQDPGRRGARRWFARPDPDGVGVLPREQLLAAVFDQSPVAILLVEQDSDRIGNILDCNAAAGRLLGRLPEDLVGTAMQSHLGPHDQLVVGAGHERTEVRIVVAGESRWAIATLSPLRGEHARPIALVVLQDITERRRAEDQLHRAARHDPLTGLINRDEILRRLNEIPGHHPDRTHVAVLFADLDGFKVVNDTRGHQVGDRVLVAVARRIRQAVRPGDFVGRIGGDEFVIVCPRLGDPRDARGVAERVRESIDKPIAVTGRTHQLGVSIGIAAAASDDVDAPELLRRADLAMYRAKASRQGIRFYDKDLDRDLADDLRLREDLRSALIGQGIKLQYQPVVTLATGSLSYVEALVRLVEDDGRLVYPSDFLPVAEQSGLMPLLGQRVLEVALKRRESWAARGHPVAIGLNVSQQQLLYAQFAATLLAILERHQVPPDSLVLEVSELGVVDASGPVQLALRRLRAAGIRIAIDHFGTGYSSLSALLHVGADRVKVDRSFVSSVPQSAPDRAVVSAAISVAHSLGQRVVAEGVETVQQLEILAELGCDELQGYLVSGGPVDDLDLSRASWRGLDWPQT